MNETQVTIKRALISVSDKTGIIDFARALQASGVEIISTGGTSKLLRAENIPVCDVSDLTGFPEMMDGRLKTLHPLVHGGILGLRDEHAEEATAQHIQWIDLVVVNLYPFAATIQKPNVTFDEAIENIDIGGPTMIRAAAKNMGWVSVVVDPNDYAAVLAELQDTQKISFATRKQLATKAFTHTAEYDARIQQYLTTSAEKFPAQLNLQLEKYADLRYGENPHQEACAYRFTNAQTGILAAAQLQGKQLSYNNIADADAALACVREFMQPACVVIKHANPCGVAVAADIETAFTRAYNADSVSAFGGIIALNRPCDENIAIAIANVFVEVLIAPDYSPAALKVLASKPNLRILKLDFATVLQREYKFIDGGLLIQEKDISEVAAADLKVVTTTEPSKNELETMLFAWRVLKHVKSNAILLAKADATVGIGAGQVSRIDAVEIALQKAGENRENTILASDAFFPFRDSIDRIAQTGVRAIIQPGGSIKDAEVITACNEHGIAMVFTGKRCFKH